MVLYIEEKDIRRLASWDNLIKAMEGALYSYSHSTHPTEGCEQPLRTKMDVPQNNGILHLMPGYLNSSQTLAAKILTVYPDNVKKGLKAVTGTILLMEGQTGRLQAIIDAKPVTELRTAATTAAVNKKFFPNGCDSMAIIGAGTQGRSHARALSHALHPKKINIWSRNAEHAADLVKTLSQEGIKATQCQTAKEAVQDVDMICVCTNATSPVLFKEWVKPGAFINSVGASTVKCQEIDPELMRSATLYVDSIESALSESGDVVKSGVKDFTEVGKILRDPSHRRPATTTLFKSLGLAVEDVAASQLLYDAWKKEQK